MSEIPLFELNPALDRARAVRRFAEEGRVQLRDFLTLPAAQTIHGVLSRETPWGLAWQAGEDGPHGLRQQQLAAQAPAEAQAISSKVATAVRGGDYAFAYAQYQILTAVQEGWHQHPALDLLIEHINAEPMMDLARAVSGIPGLVKADAQATLYGPHHFLALHDDSHVAEGRQVAYVMNFCAEDWRPDWGGYLLFYDDEGDVVAGFRPRFNTLNMFRVPQKHNVAYVPPFAPIGRFAITGWFRDR
jgi:SM-20-related protein